MAKLSSDNFIPDYPDADFLTDELSALLPDAADITVPEIANAEDFDRRLNALLLDLGDYPVDLGEPSGIDETQWEDIAPAFDAPVLPVTDELALPVVDAPASPVEPEEVPQASAFEDEYPSFADEDEIPPILDLSGESEATQELESAYIRRVAAREARAKKKQRDADDEIPSFSESDIPSLEEMDEDIDAELDAFFDAAAQKPGFAEKLKAPLVRYLAVRQAKQKLREQEAASWPAPLDIRTTPELSPLKASRYYGSQLRSILLRLIVCAFLTLIQLWIGFRLPMAGSLGDNARVQAGVSLVFLLATMVCTLDIVSIGVRQIFSLQPTMEALCAAACFFGLADAVFVMAGLSRELPFCAAASLSLCAALWGNYLKCLASSLNLKSASYERDGSILTAEEDTTDGLTTLIRSQREHSGIVRRSEEPDGSQNAYAVAAPIFLVLSLALGSISTIGGSWTSLPHHISAYIAVCANAAGFLCFALPYLSAVMQLRQTGSAIAGWPGCADIGRSHRVIVTDTDMFPAGTIRLAGVNIQEGANVEKVVSYLVSLLNESGSSVTDAFSELMQYRKYSLLTVEDFKCHDGGGLSAYIHGEAVLAGSSGFLALMGIRLPQGLDAENAICIAISNELMGVFTMQYIPIKGVRYALNLLLLGHTQPVFAIRDFNITPLMIQKLFRIPAINFVFPSFRERYRLSAQFASHDTPPAAVLTRAGIRCAVETAETGRKLYIACILNTVLSLFSSVLGLLYVFLMLKNGTVIACGKLLLYAMFWLLPVFATAFWTGR